MITWRRVALAYPCTCCGAPPGIPCYSNTGKRIWEIHQARANLASANDWRDPDDSSCGTLPQETPRS